MSYTVFESTDYGPMATEYPNPGCEFCQDCGLELPCRELSFARIGLDDVILCTQCYPKCNVCGAPVSMIGERELCLTHEREACEEALRDDPSDPYARRTMEELRQHEAPGGNA